MMEQFMSQNINNKIFEFIVKSKACSSHSNSLLSFGDRIKMSLAYKKKHKETWHTFANIS